MQLASTGEFIIVFSSEHSFLIFLYDRKLPHSLGNFLSIENLMGFIAEMASSAHPPTAFSPLTVLSPSLRRVEV
jgi:hypothetical protein